MRVCVDCHPAWSQTAGIGRAVRGLIESLPAHCGDDDLDLFAFGDERMLAPPVARARREGRGIPGRLVRRLWRHAGIPSFERFAGRADVFHFTNYACPPVGRGRSVVTVYDTTFLHFPATVEPRNLRALLSLVRQSASRADALVTLSAHSAAAVAEAYGLPAGRVHVVPPGIDARFERPKDDVIDAVRIRHRLAAPYLLCVGTLEPRKNVAFLVDVYERAAWFEGDLVIAGSLGWKYEPILARIRESRRASTIRLLRRVADDELAALYAGAEAFVFPSLDEGFGFPPLEAMACGTPVVASTGGALPEVLGDAAILLAPSDATAWSAAVRRSLEDTGEHARLTSRGRVRARHWSWDSSARRAWELYRSLAP